MNTESTIILVLAAMFSGIDQIIRLEWYHKTWLPVWFLYWNTNIGKIDAWHTYQGMVYFLLPLGFIINHSPLTIHHSPLIFLVVAILIWFQVRNLFMHFLFMRREYWQFPFFRRVI